MHREHLESPCVSSQCRAASQGAAEDSGCSWKCLCICLWKSPVSELACPSVAQCPGFLLLLSPHSATAQILFSFRAELLRAGGNGIFLFLQCHQTSSFHLGSNEVSAEEFTKTKKSPELDKSCAGWRIYLSQAQPCSLETSTPIHSWH